MALSDNFRALADAYVQHQGVAARQRKDLQDKWEKTKGILGEICGEVADAAKEYEHGFSAGFSCLNGECILLMSYTERRHELKFRLDLDRKTVVVTDDVGGVEHAFDFEPFDKIGLALEERVGRFQEAFFRSLEQRSVANQ